MTDDDEIVIFVPEPNYSIYKEALMNEARTRVVSEPVVRTKTAYLAYRGTCKKAPPHWDDLETWLQEALTGTLNQYRLMKDK
jgi:hypothetical protein